MTTTIKPTSGAQREVVKLNSSEEREQLGKSLFQLGLQRLRRDVISLIALAVLTILVILAIFAPVISSSILRVDYGRPNPINAFLPAGAISTDFRKESETLRAGKIHTVVGVGSLGSEKRGFIQTMSPVKTKAGFTSVRFINASPNAGTLDVYLNQETSPLSTVLTFGEETDNPEVVEVPVGKHDLVLRVRGKPRTDPPLFEAKGVEFAEGGALGLIAGMNGSQTNSPLGVKMLRSDLSNPGDQARVEIVSALPDVAAIKATLGGNNVGEKVEFGTLTSNTTAPGKYEIKLFQSNAPIHYLGTDELGRDQLARLLYGAQVSLGIGFIAAVLSIGIGFTLGILMGFYGGRFDDFVTWMITTIGSIPYEFILLLVATVFRPSPGGLILILGLLGWFGFARLARGETLSIREREYIISARSIGASPLRIMLRYIAPNMLSVLIIALALDIGSLILAESALSFLGLGIQPPTPSWGNMLTKSNEFYRQAPHLVFWPGVLISITVLCTFIIGDGLRDAFDPQLTKR